MKDLRAYMRGIGARARSVAAVLALAPTEQKDAALLAIARLLEMHQEDILAANARDFAKAQESGLNVAGLNRLRLDAGGILGMVAGLRTIAGLDDPVGKVMAAWQRPNGLEITRVRTPLGVVGAIYESRPNVTADVSALCLKSGNAVILRGGSDCYYSSLMIHHYISVGLEEAGLPKEAIQMVESTERLAVGEMLQGCGGAIDVLVPRGGKSLVSCVQKEARVPIFSHLEGLCHIYIDASADVNMARRVAVNAKLRRPEICGAMETLLIDVAAMKKFIPVLEALAARGCEIRACSQVRTYFPMAIAATEDDWSTEYLAPILSVRAVAGVKGAIEHISRYSSGHTEAIISQDKDSVVQFFQHLDSAILLHNASTQFADGGEFGFGGEIGIATGKMHARGPIGLEQLTTFQYQVHGCGQIRP